MALYEKRYPSWEAKDKDTQARSLAMNYTQKADKILDALEDPKETP